VSDPTPAVQDLFRHAMRRQITGVSVIATHVDGTSHGMTANAVMSLSMEPPALVVSVKQTASLHAPLLAARRFSVSYLSAGQDEVATAAGGRLQGAERFALSCWARTDDAIPYVAGAVAVAFCDVATALPWNTHTVIVGHVTDVLLGDNDAPLYFRDGRFGALGPAAG